MSEFKVSDYLKNVKIDDNIVKLPEGQLSRDDYLKVKKSLEGIGGKWKGGKISGFVFKTNPSALLEKLTCGEVINLKKEFQFFATPEKIADKLVYYSDIQNHDTVLEPSAGQGAIIQAINKVSVVIPDCYELMEQNRQVLSETELRFELIGNDFLKSESGEYSKIIANPPFTKNQDIDHIHHMYDKLGNGGRLVTLSSTHWQISQNKKETAFSEWLIERNAEIIRIEPGEFKESGTTISCNIIIIDKEIMPLVSPTEASSRQGVGPAEKPNGLGLDKGMHCQSDKHPSDCCEPKGKATDRAVRDNKLDKVTYKGGDC